MGVDLRIRALNRFGFGARPGERARIGDARAWLKQQLDRGAPTASAPDGASVAEIAAGLRALREAARGNQDARKEARQRLVQVAQAEARSAIHERVASDRPYVERLVALWSNHLCVSAAAKLPVAVLAGSYEREAIRPHVLGKFEDLVLASAKHPAMLIYLDNAQSIGPSSRAAKLVRRRANAKTQPGLNENYARELMELHTLGVNGGYTQQDVIELAKILTGWSVTGLGGRGAGERWSGGASEFGFIFRPQLHEPGKRTLLGVHYSDSGFDEGEKAIRTLCRHPSTAAFIATKLVRHFVSDEPPSTAVDRIAKVFRDTQGDLREVSAALVDLPEAWVDQNRKFRTPQDWLVAVMRATDMDATMDADSPALPLHRSPAPAPALPLAPIQALRQLRHPLWSPAAPKGFGDTMAEWADPDSLMNRAELARTVGRRVSRAQRVDPVALLDVVEISAGDPLRSMMTDQTIAPEDRVALLLASPAFQWR